MMRKFLFVFGLFLIAFWFLTQPLTAPANFVYGVTFSLPYARDTLGLDWQKAYLAVLDDLKVGHIRIPAYWTELEGKAQAIVFTGAIGAGNPMTRNQVMKKIKCLGKLPMLAMQTNEELMIAREVKNILSLRGA